MIIAITGIGEQHQAYQHYNVDQVYSFAELGNAATYQQLLTSINESTTIIGHSAGSLVALSIAAKQKLRQLILIGPGLELTDTSELLAKNPQTPITIDKSNPSFMHYVAQHPVAEMQIAERFRVSATAALDTVLANQKVTFVFAANELAKQQYTESLLDARDIPYQIIEGCNHYDILNQSETQTYINNLL
ncbi:alpha/beta hydrolase [Culicoidibacter larvae]|uniref:Alpha/beta hydrolase n=1 Tax=Culicoidibacter larvae TaxID=2579976 RepID=A0A5R8Q9I2_9FIRM|nr:alpha/beta hydrolase [Culicoidibacter larvae]TLG72029.1 alpha/beta hydrolase [Culicoidibacter larvae]